VRVQVSCSAAVSAQSTAARPGVPSAVIWVFESIVKLEADVEPKRTFVESVR
jgi:hypothetical protein